MRISLILLGLCLPTLTWASSSISEAESLIPNFRVVSPGLYRGGNPMRDPADKSGLQALSRLGIAVVINLQGADGNGSWKGWIAEKMQPGESAENRAEAKRYLESVGIEFVNLPFPSHSPVTNEGTRLIEEVVSRLDRASGARPVFVHCEHGIDRTGLVIALHRLRNRGWTVKESYDEWVNTGHDITVWAFTGSLDEYFFQVAGEGFPVGYPN